MGGLNLAVEARARAATAKTTAIVVGGREGWNESRGEPAVYGTSPYVEGCLAKDDKIESPMNLCLRLR